METGQFIKVSDIFEDTTKQLLWHARMPEVLPKPTDDDDEQWSFPYGRISFNTFAKLDTEYGTYKVDVAFFGIIEESDLTGRLFLDDQPYVAIIDPDGTETEIPWARQQLMNVLSSITGGYSFWNLPKTEGDTTFLSYLVFGLDDDEDDEYLAIYVSKAIAEHVNYARAIDRGSAI